MNRKYLDEFKIRYPSLKALASMQYEDPRQSENCKKIFHERESVFMRDGKIYGGSYVVYNDSRMPDKYVAVHVCNEIDEDTGEAPIHVIAIDPNKSKVINRMNYRARVSKKGCES